MKPLLLELRESTSAAHTRLEQTLDMEAASQNTDAYRKVLGDFLGFYEPVEKAMARHGWRDTDFSPAERQKTAWLVNDLKALGLDETQIAGLPRCQDLPELADQSEAFGAAYVLEGATLGGRQITAWLDRSAISPEARAFFASYREKVGENWKAFCTALESHPQKGGDSAGVVKGANETFSSLERWLARSGTV